MIVKRLIGLCGLALLTALAACGGGGDSSSVVPPPPPVLLTKAEAFQLLNQGTFGANDSDASHLISLGDNSNSVSRWLDEQIAKPASTQLAYVQAGLPNPIPAGFNISSLNTQRVDVWFQNSLNAPDQLRQRVAWALSNIMVISQNSSLVNYPYALADYYDMLARDAFGNFRTLLQDVTLHVGMGLFLNVLGNRKPDPAHFIRPDENYAREVMQLFTIGLVQLNTDGSTQLVNGQPVPTYDQLVVEGFANAYTGWSYAGGTSFAAARHTLAAEVLPMQAYTEQHSTVAKRVLSYPGAALTTIPADQTPAQDLHDALDNIFNHPNVGPFICKQLIQRLVTSNPTPGYVQRVVEKFNNDGSGVRGNMTAVIRAILLDSEARSAPSTATNGKTKEPLLRLTQLWRAYGAKAASGKYQPTASGGPTATFGEGPLLAGSVFNFFSPSYAPPGEISAQNLVAPELQLATEYQNTLVTNFFWTQAIGRTTAQTGLGADVVVIDTTAETALAADSESLVNKVADRLLAGQISATLKAQTKAQIERSSATTGIATRVGDAIYMIASSPEFARQR